MFSTTRASLLGLRSRGHQQHVGQATGQGVNDFRKHHILVTSLFQHNIYQGRRKRNEDPGLSHLKPSAPTQRPSSHPAAQLPCGSMLDLVTSIVRTPSSLSNLARPDSLLVDSAKQVVLRSRRWGRIVWGRRRTDRPRTRVWGRGGRL